jgi:hypothetical protein
MSRSIRKSAAVAAFVFACVMAGLGLPAVAKTPRNPPLEDNAPLFEPFEEFQVGFFSEPLPDPPPPLRAPSETERRVCKRILAGWQTRHARIGSFFVAWDLRSKCRRFPKFGPMDSHTQQWVDRDFRRRTLRSSPWNGLAYEFAFDGMTACMWHTNARTAHIWNGDPDSSLHWDTVIWRFAVDPLCSGLIDTASPNANVLSENAIIGNRHCVKLLIPVKYRYPTVDLVDTLWVDPARDNVIVGWQRGALEAPAPFVSIEYAQDSKQGWLPTHWHMTSASAVDESSSAARRIAIDQHFSIAIFRPTLPLGTQVNDQQLAQGYVIGPHGTKTQIQKYSLNERDIVSVVLEARTDFVVYPEPLKDVLEFIARRYQIKAAFDDRAIREGLIDPAVQVQTKKHGIKVKELLELLLKQSPKPLRYEIRSDVLTVIAFPAARDSSK